jgi:electron transfer flavoprotein alpha subunit
LGHQVSHLLDEAFAHGADDIRLADHPLLESFTVEAYTNVTYQTLIESKPSVFLCGATPNGRDLAGRLAVRLRTGLNADCTDLKLNPESGILTSEVTGFGGGVLALLESPNHRPQMSTVRPGVFQKREITSSDRGQVIKIEVEITKDQVHTKVLDRVVGEGVDLTKAEVLLCGGRGIGGHFEMLEDLAQILDGEVGATRPPVDEGHIERDRQVGQTGVVCRPKVALTCGISGAFHFVVGIQDADLVVAVNTDPEAPMFEFSDYCVVADALSFIPKLIEVVKTEKAISHV